VWLLVNDWTREASGLGIQTTTFQTLKPSLSVNFLDNVSPTFALPDLYTLRKHSRNMSTTVRGPLYSALGPTEMRLLSLHSGREEEPIRCSLRHAELRIDQRLVWKDLILHKLETDFTLRKIKKRLKPSRQPKFEAFSYCWGPAELYKSIEVNGQQVPVRRNLWWALWHLRHGVYGMRRTLWIDALCINQNDLIERNAQVSIVGSIYSTASRVLIWL
jgi:Heterokaryon incompatibility protein (HET)